MRIDYAKESSAKDVGEAVGTFIGTLVKYASFSGTVALIVLKVFAGAQFSWWWCLLPVTIQLAFIALALIVAILAISMHKAGK